MIRKHVINKHNSIKKSALKEKQAVYTRNAFIEHPDSILQPEMIIKI